MNRNATLFSLLVLITVVALPAQAQTPATWGEGNECLCVSYEPSFELIDEEAGTYEYTVLVTNNCSKDLSYVAFGVNFEEGIEGPPEGEYDDYTVEHTGWSGLPGFPSIKFEDLMEPNTGETLEFVFTLSNSDPDGFRLLGFKKGNFPFWCVGVLPVELTSFVATVDGQDTILRWETASETNNAGFDVQLLEAGEWETLTFIEGHGTTEVPQIYSHRVNDLDPGTHVFRLKQVDFDGTFEHSPTVEVFVGLPTTYVVKPVYPNPFNPEATLRFAVEQEQSVKVTLHNILGQKVRTLFSGTATSGQMHRVEIDGENLSSGVYLVRVQGERFVETQRVVLAK